MLTILRGGLEQIFEGQPLCGEARESSHRAGHLGDARASCARPGGETTLLIDARGFPPEGDDCDAALAKKAYELGWRHLVHYNSRGTRFHAVGFGPAPTACGSTATTTRATTWARAWTAWSVYVHGNAQDQLGQIAKRGKLVVHGDVGQTFLYGAKGGEFYVLGNAAGRPLINAVGTAPGRHQRHRARLPGRVVHGRRSAERRRVRHRQRPPVRRRRRTSSRWSCPIPGSNLLSLASGGAIYVRDPHHTLVEEQLNGGAYRSLIGRRLEAHPALPRRRTSGCSASRSSAICSPSTASCETRERSTARSCPARTPRPRPSWKEWENSDG